MKDYRHSTWNERFGKEKADQLRLKFRKTIQKIGRGKTWEEIRGFKKAQIGKIKNGKRFEGKSLSHIYGKEKSEEIILNNKTKFSGKSMIENFGYKYYQNFIKTRKGKSLEEIYGIEKAKKLRSDQSKLIIKLRKSGAFGNRPNSYEKKIIDVNKKYNLGFKYVGNGKFWLENINPDFVNEDLKIIIEVYSIYWKNLIFKSEVIYKKIRTKICKKYGYTIIFINDKELKKGETYLRIKIMNKSKVTPIAE